MRSALRLGVLAAVTVLCCVTGFVLDQRWLLPVLDMLPGFAIMVAMLRAGRREAAIGLTIAWALILALTTVCLTNLWHQRAEQVILNGPAYRDEMVSWIATGVGTESTPSQFIPQHLLHAAAFCALSLLTASALSILMGTVLLNYMSFYVGDLIHRCQGSGRLTAVLLAWNPWSMVRVASFIILGVVLAEPLLSRFSGDWPSPSGRRRWLIAGVAGLLADMLLKTLLAPLWPPLLRDCLG